MSLSNTVLTKSCRTWQHPGWRCALVAIVLGLIAPQTFPQTDCVEEQKLTASDAAPGDLFGVSVSVNGDTAVVGAQLDDCAGGGHCGSAYVFRLDGTDWVEEQKLTASDAAPSDLFGVSVSVSGDTTVVGAFGDQCASGRFCGSAYVFRFDGTSWVEEQKLTASDASGGENTFDGDQFGRSVSVSGDIAVVGATNHNCPAGIDCGAAYVFRFNGAVWVEEQELVASNAAAGNRFGRSVSVAGETVVVGATGDDCRAGRDCGSAYVFRFNGHSWVEEQRLTASDMGAIDVFGSSVSVSGKTVVVGAQLDDCAAGEHCGSAYVFRFDGTSWVEEQELVAPTPAEFDLFGGSVSVSGELAVVGAIADDCTAGPLCGSAYVFRFNGASWVEVQKLTAPAPAEFDLFGSPISVSGKTIMVGASHDGFATGNNWGAVYVFSCASAPSVASLDIRPGSCPNPLNPRSQGVVPVTLVGDSDFDVATIDPDSLTLVRADGVGGSVSPLSDRRGPRIIIEDVATPFSDEPCGCHALSSDGIDDLSLKFSTAEMSRALELNALSRGETIELVLRGTLLDGTTFEAVDCIRIPGRQGNLRGIRRTGKSK